MANDRLIEVISPQSYEAIQKMTASLTEAFDVTVKWNNELNKNKNLKPSDSTRVFKETASAIRSTQGALSDYEKTQNKLANTEKRQ